jgi:hypothetical protein
MRVRAEQHNLLRMKIPRDRLTEGAYLRTLDHMEGVAENIWRASRV